MSVERRQTYREKARVMARQRRHTSKSLMEDLSNELPFPKEVVDSLDQSSRLRLATCYIRVKSLFADSGHSPTPSPTFSSPNDNNRHPVMPARTSGHTFISTIKEERGGEGRKEATYGVLQDMFMESLDGFLLICQKDGQIIYLSDCIHKHLGLFQSDLVGHNLSNLVHESDMMNVSQSIENAYMRLLGERGNIDCSFFCRMKCNDKRTGASLNYKLIYLSGHLKLQEDGTTLLMGVASPVTPPTIIELNIQDNMFVTHYSLDMRCVYFDGRLTRLLGYEHDDWIGHVPFEFHHHDDMDVTLKCSQEVMERGEGMSGYYRMMTKHGHYVWIQSRANIVYDKRTPSYVFCVSYLIVDDTLPKNGGIKRSLEPLPITIREGGTPLSPFPLSPVSSVSSTHTSLSS